jgi:RNA polymerase sigma-70 factor, ECF subfamily
VSRAAVFLEHVPAAARAELAAIADLERTLDELVATGRTEWPALAVDEDAFVHHVAAHIPADDASRALFSLHAGDLFLAFACAGGERRAVDALEDRLAEVGPTLARQGSAALADEVKQLLRQRLLVADAGERPKIAEYSGRGPLVAWLRVAAVRTALDLHRRANRERISDGADLAGLQAAADPEMEVIKNRYREDFRDAFHAAVADLTSRDRNVLRLHFLDGLSIDEIGVIYRVHRSTVARWIARSRDALLEETRRRMREKLQLASGEFESLMGLVQSQLDVSIHRFLSQSGE